MDHKKRLFTIDRADIRVTIDLGFDGEELKLDGYDIGKTGLHFPSSINSNKAKVAIGFVIDAIRKIASFFMGIFASI